MANKKSLSDLRNLEAGDEKWLSRIGVKSRRDLELLGSVMAYRLLTHHGYKGGIEIVHAIEGALRDIDVNRLPAAVKRRLKTEALYAAKPRCAWAGSDLLYMRYHDEEWGVPVHDDRTLFEFLILEGAQAGLSWITILRKREAYRVAFDNFDARRVARYDKRRIAQLMKNPGIVRNRLKIEATVTNARAFLTVQAEFGSFDRYLWRHVDGRTIVNRPASLKNVPARTPISDALSKDLKKRGFRFVGSTICYAYMQAVGMVNDHTRTCFRCRKM